MTPGDFFSFMAALLLMYGPAKKLSRVNAEPAAGDGGVRAHLRDARHAHRSEGAAGAPALAPFRRAIEFRDVGFGYEDGQRGSCGACRSSVAAGQMIAIVGRSGAGKTTMVNLLPRFYDVTGGAILIDGVDIRDVTLASLRAQIGIVTQETVLFDDTIAQQHRLRLAERARRARAIEAAARAANAHDFIVGAARTATRR